MADNVDGVKRPRLHRWADCRCPQCGRRHRDLVSTDTRRRGGPHRQACDHCFLRGAREEAKKQYRAYKLSLAPPDDGEPEVERPVQPPLPFQYATNCTTTT